MSALVQNFNLSGYRKYEHAQYHGIVHGSKQRSNAYSTKDVCDGRVEKLAIFRYGLLKSKNMDKYTIESLHDA